jgi:hypothetical protein
MAATRHAIQWVKNVYGGGAIYRSLPEGASETFKKGAILNYSAAGNDLAEIPRTAGVPDTQELLGIAAEDANNDSNGAELDYLVPRPGDVFSAALASDQDTIVAPDTDNIGKLAGIIKLSTTGGAGTEYVVDEGNTNWVKILDLDPRDVANRGSRTLSAGDRVLFQFLGAILDSDGQTT